MKSNDAHCLKKAVVDKKETNNEQTARYWLESTTTTTATTLVGYCHHQNNCTTRFESIVAHEQTVGAKHKPNNSNSRTTYLNFPLYHRPFFFFNVQSIFRCI